MKDGKMILRIPFPGFYESMLSGELDNEETQLAESLAEEGNEFAGREVSDICDALYWCTSYGAAHAAIAKEYAEAFGDFVNDECIAKDAPRFAFAFESMDSPREYNFTTDRCYVSLPVVDFRRMCDATDSEVLARVIRRKFTSRDGFMSFYSNDIAEWTAKPVDEWDHNEAGTLLEAYLETHMADQEERIDLRVFERITGNGEFCNALSDAIDWEKLKERMQPETV